MRRHAALVAWTLAVVLASACGERGATTPAAVAAPTPSATASPVGAISFLASAPPPGGAIQTGLPDPASSRTAAVTTGLTMSFMVSSSADTTARLEVVLSSPQSGVCLTNAAPGGVPAAPAFTLRAGFPRTVTVSELLLSSVCSYPNRVTQATARLLPGLVAALGEAPLHEATFALEYTIGQ